MKAQMIRKLMGLVVVSASLSLAACGKKGGSGANRMSGPNLLSCSTCTGATVPLLQQVSFAADGYLDGKVDILAKQAMGTFLGDPKAILKHSGEAAIIGRMMVLQDRNWFTCGALAGDYAIRAIAIGTNMMGVIQGQRLEAVHQASGYRIGILVRSSQVYNTDGGGVSRASPNNRIGLNMIFETVNGQPCMADIATH